LVVYVDPDAPGPNTGASWQFAFPDLVTGLAAAAAFTGQNQFGIAQVWVAEGKHVPGTTESSTFNVGARTEVYGSFLGWPTGDTLGNRQGSPSNTILSGDVDADSSALPDADDAWHVVTMQGLGCRLDGFTVTNGYADGPSGIGVHDSSGAGILLAGGSSARATIANCTVQLCVAEERGAGLFATNAGGVRIRHCTFVSNVCVGDGVTTGFGGAIAFDNVGSGGSPTDSLGIGNCVFARNRAARGGAISLEDVRAPVAAYNCRFHDNVAQWVGGAIHVGPTTQNPQTGFLEIFHSTIAYNQTLNGGGVPIIPSGSALYIEANAPSPDLPVIVRSSILWDNFLHADTDQTIAGTTSALTITFSDLQDTYNGPQPGWTNNISQDPLFVSSTLRDLRLQAGSPCIDAATDTPLNAGLPNTPNVQVGDLADIDNDSVVIELVPWELRIGLAREIDDGPAGGTGFDVTPPAGISDMGCYERQSDG
jgi:hypothetical protein